MKKIGRLIILVFLAVIFINCQEERSKTGLLPSPEIEPEEYDVYSSLIEGRNSDVKKYYNDEIIVIESTTVPIYISDDPNWAGLESISREGSYLRGFNKKISIFEIGRDTLEDFERKNLYPSTLSYQFDLKIKYLLCSSEESLELKRKGDYWQQFYTWYPDSRCKISFSRVGFNSDRTKAVVYHAWGVGPLAAAGRFFFLAKVNNEWTVKKYITIWVS